MDATVTPDSAVNLNDQAVRLHAEGRYDDAAWVHKQALAAWEATVGSDDPFVAQSLANRASAYRMLNEHHEAERLFQMAQRIWAKRGFPKNYGQPLWADELDERGMLRQFGAHVRSVRERVEKGDPAARAEVMGIIEKLGPWYHNVVFAPGVMSNPSNPDYPASRLRFLEPVIPKSLEGKSVLDIGCNSGFFALEMKKRGAARVVAVDIMPHLLAQARFASHWFDLPLELYECGAYDLPALGWKFDIIVFVGVLYHLKHPLYALEQIASICNETMFFQSVVRGPAGDVTPQDDYDVNEIAAFDQPAWPKLYFIEKNFKGDESKWRFATRSCLKAMLRTAGFRVIDDTAHPEVFACHK